MTALPRVVFNALPLGAGGGVDTYIRELLFALAPLARAELAAAVQADQAGELPPGVRPILTASCAGWRRALAGIRGFGAADLVHGLDVDVPIGHDRPRVATVHDLAVFDVPWAFPRRRAAAERLIVRTALARADRIIAVSAFTAARVRERFGLEATVVHEAPGPDMRPPRADEVDAARAEYALPEQFVLHVGNIEPRKDVATLAEACRIAGLRLVLTGEPLWGTPTPRGCLSLGRVPRARLPALFNAATVVAYASRYEGFGLPPIEAMACGAAVVTTAVPAVVETVGKGAELFAAGDVDGLRRTLVALFADGERRRQLASEGRSRVSALSWGRTAAETLGVYRSLGIDA